MGIVALEASSPDAVFAFLDERIALWGRAHWTWKYRLGAGGDARAFIHTGPDGTVNAFIGTLPTRLHLADGRTVRAAWFVDWVNAGGGVGAGIALLRRAQATTEVLLALQGSLDTRAILPKLRWQEDERPGHWVLPLTGRAMAARGPFRTSRALRPLAPLAARWLRPRPPTPGRWTVEEVARLPSSYDEVWAQRRAQFAPLMDRSSATVNATWADIPGDGFTLFLLRDRGAVVGHAILRLDRTPDHVRGRLIDALWDRTQPDMATWVVAQSVWWLGERGADVIECTASVDDLEAALARNRFSRRRAAPIWTPALPAGVPPTSTWYVTLFDCDQGWR